MGFSELSPELMERPGAAKPVFSYQLEPLDSKNHHLRTHKVPHLSIFCDFLKVVEIGKNDTSISRDFFTYILLQNRSKFFEFSSDAITNLILFCLQSSLLHLHEVKVFIASSIL